METPGPERNMDTGILLKELIKASMKAAEIPDVIFGSTTLKNAEILPHPRLHAASSTEKSNWSRLDPTTVSYTHLRAHETGA